MISRVEHLHSHSFVHRNIKVILGGYEVDNSTLKTGPVQFIFFGPLYLSDFLHRKNQCEIQLVLPFDQLLVMCY